MLALCVYSPPCAHRSVSVQLAAEMSLPPVSPAAAQLLLPTVETEVRRLIQIAHKFQKRGKQRRLTVHAINLALSSSGMEPLYGLHRSSHLEETLRSRADGHPSAGQFTHA